MQTMTMKEAFTNTNTQTWGPAIFGCVVNELENPPAHQLT